MKRTAAIVGPIAGLLILGTSVMFFQNCAPGFSLEDSKQTGLGSTSALPSPTGAAANSDLGIMVGLLKTTAAGVTGGLAVEGRMMMVRSPNAGTQVYLQANGFPTTATFMSHVHDQPCAIGGGGHYKVDSTNTAAVASNELWPNLTVNATDGTILGSISNDKHMARPEAQSVVFHSADSTRVACGSFYPQGGTTQKGGTFTALTGAAGKPIAGSAVLIRNGGAAQTIFKIAVTGLAPNTTHMAHVHSLPCGMTDGGAHYKRNAAVTEATASAANEIWATIVTSATGSGTARVVIDDHVARADAASVVIHDPMTPATRMACADLNTDQSLQSTALGLERARNVTGVANLTRLPDGTTSAVISAKGLLPATAYTAHVHDHPCAIAGGGGHYKIDPTNMGTSEANEMWLKFTTDAAGAGLANASFKHLARPEAQSMVIHDPADSMRIACVDLY